MSNDKVWVAIAIDVSANEEPLRAVFSSVKGANHFAADRSRRMRVIGPLTVQQPKAAAIQAKIDKLQRELEKQLTKESNHE